MVTWLAAHWWLLLLPVGLAMAFWGARAPRPKPRRAKKRRAGKRALPRQLGLGLLEEGIGRSEQDESSGEGKAS